MPEISDKMKEGMGSIRKALKGGTEPAAAPPVASTSSPEPTKDMSQMRQKADDAKAKWMKENNVDENGDPIKPSGDAMKRRLEKVAE